MFVRVTATLLLCGMLSQVDIFFFLVYCVRWGLDCLRLSFLLLFTEFFDFELWVPRPIRLGFLLVLLSQSCCCCFFLVSLTVCALSSGFTTEFPSAGAVYRKLMLSSCCGLPSTVKSRLVRVMVSCSMSG